MGLGGSRIWFISGRGAPSWQATDPMAKLLCVYCGSSNSLESRYYSAAEEVGRAMVANGWGLVYGGGNVGMMGSLARAGEGRRRAASSA